jgi:tRNA uridine 5-carboxymethylaminomethyl modification enzyme
LLKRPEVGYDDLAGLGDREAPSLPAEIRAQVETAIKYAGYIERQQAEVARRRTEEDVVLPGDLDYQSVRGLSFEVRQTLAARRPETIGQASRLPGITPAAISLLLVHLKRRSSPMPPPAAGTVAA